ncbi:MAG: DNA cytosine methyltransferase, partial [Phascolarctobacterium sp.]|nr:DNA cytosine methyltransferase [Phascolarctobacterium sp.]
MRLQTFFDFCSGIGGGRLGLERCGMKCVGYSDTSRLSVTTYKLMHDTENEKNYGNIKR